MTTPRVAYDLATMLRPLLMAGPVSHRELEAGVLCLRPVRGIGGIDEDCPDESAERTAPRMIGTSPHGIAPMEASPMVTAGLM